MVLKARRVAMAKPEVPNVTNVMIERRNNLSDPFRQGHMAATSDVAECNLVFF